jgi:iron complex outermembrane recepter protein
LNNEEKMRIGKSQPASKFIFTLNYKKGKTGFVINNTRFGETNIAPLVDANRGIFMKENFSPKVITDISINYTPKHWLTLTAGTNNTFNVYPDKIKHYENTGQGIRIYSPEGSAFGFNGGYYFITMRITR